MTNPLFSSYRTGENRVTSSTLAVFERLDVALVTELLATATETELTGVEFTNQVSGDGSVPDARIRSRFDWWFETKTQARVYESEPAREQVRRHVRRLPDEPGALLFVLTPDPRRPAWFSELDGVPEEARDRVVWLGFRGLADAIGLGVDGGGRVLGERARFLLTELLTLYENEGLLALADTVVVAASAAWPEYRRVGAYVCQAERAFRADVMTHLGFYTERAIQPLVPEIRRWEPSVMFNDENVAALRAHGDEEVAGLVERLLAEGPRVPDTAYGVVLLTGPDDPRTISLPHPVANDQVSTTGRVVPWTRGHRYVRLDRLRSGIAATSQL